MRGIGTQALILNLFEDWDTVLWRRQRVYILLLAFMQLFSVYIQQMYSSVPIYQYFYHITTAAFINIILLKITFYMYLHGLDKVHKLFLPLSSWKQWVKHWLIVLTGRSCMVLGKVTNSIPVYWRAKWSQDLNTQSPNKITSW